MIVLSTVRQKQVMQISHRPWAWHWGLTWPEGADRGIHRMGAPQEKQPYVRILLVTCQRAYRLNFFFRTKCIFILSANVTPCRATRSFIPCISIFLLLMGWSLEWSFRIVVEVFHLDLHFSIFTSLSWPMWKQREVRDSRGSNWQVTRVIFVIIRLSNCLKSMRLGLPFSQEKKSQASNGPLVAKTSQAFDVPLVDISVSSARCTLRGHKYHERSMHPHGQKHLKHPMYPL